MEEEKRIKLKRLFKKIGNIVSYVFITILMLIAAFLIFYVICGKIAKSKNENPPFALYTIISPSMVPSINVYDVVFVKKTDVSKLKKGDIITFYSTNTFFGNTPITHRIVEVINMPDKTVNFKVKGDANDVPDDEKVLPDNIIGKVMFKIPKLGKIQYFLASKKGWIFAILIPSLIILTYDIFKIVRLITLRRKINGFESENKDTIDKIENDRRQEIENEIANKNVANKIGTIINNNPNVQVAVENKKVVETNTVTTESGTVTKSVTTNTTTISAVNVQNEDNKN